MPIAENLSKAELKEKAVQEVGMSTSLFYRLFSQLEADERVSIKAKTKKYTYQPPPADPKLN